MEFQEKLLLRFTDLYLLTVLMSIPFNKLPGSKGFLRVSLSVFFCNKTFRPVFLILPFKQWKSLGNHMIPKKVKIGVNKAKFFEEVFIFHSSSSFLPWGPFEQLLTQEIFGKCMCSRLPFIALEYSLWWKFCFVSLWYSNAISRFYIT